MKKIRIEKYIGDLTSLTRSEIKEKIKNKAIKINEKIINKSCQIDTSKDSVYLDGELLKYEQFQYYIFNKPSGFVCANYDSRDATIFDILPLSREKFFSYGRLDKDTEGLLLISNDGNFGHQLLSPKNKIPKKYFVKVAQSIDNNEIMQNKMPIIIDKDFIIDNYIYEKIDKKSCFITIYEGKFHQVKKMFGSIGNSVEYLKRVQFGSLKLDASLKLSQIRKLTKDEIQMLKQDIINNKKSN
ncbi:pseudouridine synthase [Mycoplasma tauri]|uniref:pseudouridine synthase n=1 Tax=Mycoplasma tauri TaxID=547987 RepID=UPI001966D898|nr:pseudouridine synthase [Mycoplasma tauri]MBZ4203722.1 16S rRNA pseudouridylate synthase [Mycoplasma tauri]MBZ4204349.1 16S rRNA pseudouridylate synthase [Mycoplasma tauri]MBZ4218435.1 16S rRNA pseudouridylate synthase [Mycoplasma tauri]MBZ4227057.1 16S rRNA pseudouridylate synthase [Mycoplasma tauri]QSB07348.1 rRNA pseudouridine synthase [Mycoplasma tauri]